MEDRTLLAAVPVGFTETRVASALSSPTSLELAPDGRVFVAQQDGTIRIIKNDNLLSTAFTKITVDDTGERGLLGITVDPNYVNNHYVYVYYTATTPYSHNRVSRFTANGDTVVAGSEQVLMDFGAIAEDQIWLMGGAIHFGPDGKLYVAVGEQQNSAYPQSLDNPFGKILRINSDGSIPTDNPFYTTTTGINRAIWAYGLRNPFTTAFQPGTGVFYINDVGQDDWEEINVGKAGANYGWPATEGYFTQSQHPGFTNPIYAFPHQGSAAITGGAFYNPVTVQFPSQYVGKYFFAEFASGDIRVFDPQTKAVSIFATDTAFPTNLAVSTSGELYYISRGIRTGGPAIGTGQVYKVQYATSSAPKITIPPADSLVSVGYSASFTVSVSGTGPFTYQWQRNGSNINGATSSTYNIASAKMSDNGAQFRVVVSNAFGTVTSTAGVLTVTTVPPPTATIVVPPGGDRYTAGESFVFSGSGQAGQGGSIPVGQYVWQVDFHHHTHAHPFIAPTGGVNQIEFTIPTSGETSDDVWYRVYLTVTDSIGLSTTKYYDIQPVLANITLQTNIAGLALNLDGQPRATPTSVTGVVGMTRALEAPAVQSVGGVTYMFDSWSDGGAALHNISFPSTGAVYTATYKAVSVTYASDMSFVGTPTNGWGPVERDRSNGEKPAGDGGMLTLGGISYSKGLGVHAASRVTYNLAGKYLWFTADIGIDDEVGDKGSVIFQVLADGANIYDSGVMTGSSATKSLLLNVAGVSQLVLMVTTGGDNDAYDHADWANARLLAPPGGTTPPVTPAGWAGFAAPVGYATGVNTHAVVAADFNGDGKLDLASVAAADNTLSVLRGRGDSTFLAAVKYGVDSGPKSVAAGDVNGDGKIDLVTANQGTGTISVLMNLGNGTFANAVTYAVTRGAHDVALADLDGDGDIDVAEVGWGNKFVRVMLNPGNGTFASGTNYAVGDSPHSVVIGDFNADGRPDLAVVSRKSNRVSVLMNQGAANFKAAVNYAVGSLPHSIAAGDLNGDGKLDLAVVNDGSKNVSVLIGSGTGTFAKAVNYATGPVPKGVTIGDVNGDGRPDILTANTAGNYPNNNNPGGNTISVLIGNGDGKFQAAQTFTTGLTPFDIVLADFDGDGDLDAVTANWHTNDLTVLRHL